MEQRDGAHTFDISIYYQKLAKGDQNFSYDRSLSGRVLVGPNNWFQGVLKDSLTKQDYLVIYHINSSNDFIMAIIPKVDSEDPEIVYGNLYEDKYLGELYIHSPLGMSTVDGYVLFSKEQLSLIRSLDVFREVEQAVQDFITKIDEEHQIIVSNFLNDPDYMEEHLIGLEPVKIDSSRLEFKTRAIKRRIIGG